ncbi:hypothetical protein [Streptosporangium sp. NPDC006930]|uniref:hypothetical protein n=1 Tax=Streptosporangium sp. NPDC006930 TaxID=3154783 RepID=UPI003429F130
MTTIPNIGSNHGRPVKPVPGYEDLFRHVGIFDKPGDPLHGEDIVPVRTFALMIAPSIEIFHAEWERQAGLIALGAQRHYTLPAEWQPGAKRRTKELQARYGTDVAYEVLRGLHREYGVFPPDPTP